MYIEEPPVLKLVGGIHQRTVCSGFISMVYIVIEFTLKENIYKKKNVVLKICIILNSYFLSYIHECIGKFLVHPLGKVWW